MSRFRYQLRLAVAAACRCAREPTAMPSPGVQRAHGSGFRIQQLGFRMMGSSLHDDWQVNNRRTKQSADRAEWNPK